MNARTFSLAIVIAMCVAVLGCSGGEPSEERGAGSSSVSESEAQAPSKAAAARGVRVEQDEQPGPEVVLSGLVYEWRTSPEKGLEVTLEFENPSDTYERARGYVFAVARSSGSAVSDLGVYPWNAELEGGVPSDYTEGTHMVYRKDHVVRGFIPYTKGEGYYDSLRVLVYSEDGDVLIDQTYALEITGEPTGPVRPKPTLVL